jgi:ribosomal protein S18 acetylase RimI-like enzyme
MADHVVREDFSPDKHLEEVQSFDCGDEPYHKSVSDWLKAVDPTDSILTDIANRGTKVWIYYNGADDLVGFGSLGLHVWSLPPYGKKKVPIVIIPNVAVARQFWGLPPDDPYSDQILDDLRAEAMQYRDERKALVLAVHPLNQRAIKFYRRHGFVMIEPPMKDGHLRMALYLGDPVNAPDFADGI